MAQSADMVVVITGASAGIGRACALLLAGQGAAVALSARRADRLDEVVADIARGGGRAVAVPGDVTVEAHAAELIDRAIGAFGSVDVAIANAGIGYHGPIDEMSGEAMRQLVDVNLLGTLYLARSAVAVFRRQGRGHFIAMSSIGGCRGIAGSGVYCATKGAQIALVESLRAEFVGTDVHASVVMPVSTYTEFHDAVERNFGYEIGRVGPRQPADAVARAVAACIARPRAEVYPHRASRALNIANALSPALTDRLVRRFARRRGDGSVFHSSGPNGARGRRE
jgi:short-subunit dehydrogenase